MRLRIILAGAVLTSFAYPLSADAADKRNKIDFSAGYYSVSATSGSSSGSLANLGIYQINLRRSFTSNLEIGLGYSFAFAGIYTGDSVYGIDLMAYYFPFTSPHMLVSSTGESELKITEKWRPFFGGGFAQRTFKSVQTDYAGVGVTVGTEFSLKADRALIFKARYLMMSGPTNATATAMDVQFGLTVSF